MGTTVFNWLDLSRYMENKTINLTAAVDFYGQKDPFFSEAVCEFKMRSFKSRKNFESIY